MRNGYNQQQQHKGTTFSLCSKPSMINDVHVPAANPSFNKAHSCSDDPSLSPKVGCMGQVKKKNLQQQQQNYKQLGMVFPTTSSTNYPANNNSTASAVGGFGHSYSKLLRLKTLLTTPSVLATTTATSKTKTTTTTTTSCSKSHHRNRLRSRSCEDAGAAIGGFGSPINVADLDPPLPVIIKKKTTSAALVSDADNNNNNSLWKRRSGGTALKGLQIQLQQQLDPGNRVSCEQFGVSDISESQAAVFKKK